MKKKKEEQPGGRDPGAGGGRPYSSSSSFRSERQEEETRLTDWPVDTHDTKHDPRGPRHEEVVRDDVAKDPTSASLNFRFGYDRKGDRVRSLR